MAHNPIYTGTLTASTWEQDFSGLVLAPPVPGNELVFWNILPKAADAYEPTKYEWVEEELVPVTIACAEDMDTTETTWTMASAAAVSKAGIRAGSRLVNATDTTKTEVILVTAVSSADLTVVRDYGGFVSGSGGGTTGETHTSGDVFRVLPSLEFEGSSVSSSDAFPYRDRSLAYNYFSLESEFTKISGSDMVRVYRGSTPDNWSYQVDGVVQSMTRKADWDVLRSPMVARGANARGSMGGLLWFATQTTGASSYCYNTSATTFAYETFDDACLAMHQRGNFMDANLVLIVPAAGAQVIPYIHESTMKMDYARENVRGYFANSLMSTISGKRIPVVVSDAIPSNSFLLLNVDAVRLHYLRGRALRMYNKPLGDQMDDYQAQRWISEFTLEFQRPLDNCYYHTGITYTRPS